MVHEVGDVRFSREETIQAFTDFYEFLRKLYLRDCDVIYPPADGWPSIVNAGPDALQALGKSDEVVALLAHLPYIRSRQQEADRDPDIFPDGHFIDWQGVFALCARKPGSAEGRMERFLVNGEGDLSPLKFRHVIPIARASTLPSPVIILDTKLGIIAWDESTCPREIQNGYWEHCVTYDDPDSDIEEDSPEWQYSEFLEFNRSWTIPGFFEVLKDQFTKLVWVPSSHYCVRDDNETLWDEEGMIAMLRSIFREHGWPDELDRYERELCLGAVRDALTLHYPNKLDYREI